VSAGGTLVRANASFKSFEPIEVADPAERDLVGPRTDSGSN
jgi:hypothetical protein